MGSEQPMAIAREMRMISMKYSVGLMISKCFVLGLENLFWGRWIIG